jgi:hypothetical protein
MSQEDFPLGADFPHEGFVQKSLVAHLDSLGFRRFPRNHLDYAGCHPDTHEIWIVEAKGKTRNTCLDFRTGLGQIIVAMTDPNARYGLAVPWNQRFVELCKNIPNHVRSVLRLHCLLVNEAGQIRIIGPDEPIPLPGE